MRALNDVERLNERVLELFTDSMIDCRCFFNMRSEKK